MVLADTDIADTGGLNSADRKSCKSATHLFCHDRINLPAYNKELALGGLRSDSSPDVHGEQSAAAVKDGGQRGHESSQHHS